VLEMGMEVGVVGLVRVGVHVPRWTRSSFASCGPICCLVARCGATMLSPLQSPPPPPPPPPPLLLVLQVVLLPFLLLLAAVFL
jgi:hypothetical protein